MKRKSAMFLPHVLMGALFCSSAAHAQNASDVKVSIIYTGKSLGALSVIRDPDEKELLQEELAKKNIKPKLSNFTCWRAPGVMVFDPEKDLKFSDLQAFLSSNTPITAVGSLSTIRSNNVTMVQYPERAADNLLELTLKNSRAAEEFPDLRKSTATLSRVRTPGGQDVLLLVEGSATLPKDTAAWTEGQVNRIDTGESVVYELPVNLAEMGPRATIIDKAVADAKAQGAVPFVIDLGEKNGDFGVDREKRAEIDYDALKSLGYSMILPYEFELGLGTTKLSELAKARGFELIASNITSSDKVFLTNKVIEQNGAKIGLFGVVDVEVKNKLPKAISSTLTFESPDAAAAREVKALQAQGVDVIIMLSNLHPKDSANIAREGSGVDIILSDLHTRWSPESLTTQVTLQDRTAYRHGSPSLIARGFGNGLGVGTLTMTFKPSAAGGLYMAEARHDLQSVSDRTEAKSSLVAEIRQKAETNKRSRGGIIFPAIEKIADQDPAVRAVIGQNNRIPKAVWEAFVARLIRVRGGAEVAMWKRVDFFPPLVGDLDEADIRSWLWTEESFVVMDLTGKDLKAAISADAKGSLAVDGIKDGKIHDLPINDAAFYRVIVTDFLLDAYPSLASGKRVQTKFTIKDNGEFEADEAGKDLQVRDFVVNELARLSKEESGADLYTALGELLRDADPFERTFTFTFDHITLTGTYNQQPSNINKDTNNQFGTLSESRASAVTSSVVELKGKLKASYDLRKTGTDLTATSAFAQTIIDGERAESNDDLKFELTERFKLKPGIAWNPQPFLSATFDTEYTPTETTDANNVTTINPRQEDALLKLGTQLSPGHDITKLQLAAVGSQSFGVDQTVPKIGLNIETEYKKALPKFGLLAYRWTNSLNYFPVIPSPTNTGLKLRYNMIHELTLPFFQDLSAVVALDLLVFQGEVAETEDFGLNAIVRFGLSYDRFWKPRYQTLF